MLCAVSSLFIIMYQQQVIVDHEQQGIRASSSSIVLHQSARATALLLTISSNSSCLLCRRYLNHHGHRHRVVPRERVIVAADAMHELHRPSRAAWHQSIVIVDARVVVHHHVISIRARAIIAESASASCRAEPKYFCVKKVFLLTTELLAGEHITSTIN